MLNPPPQLEIEQNPSTEEKIPAADPKIGALRSKTGQNTPPQANGKAARPNGPSDANGSAKRSMESGIGRVSTNPNGFGPVHTNTSRSINRSVAAPSSGSLAPDTSEEWTVSENYDLTGTTTKPDPRQPVDPTFRGWKEVGGWDHTDVLTAEDEAEDLLQKGLFFEQYLPQSAYGDWYHNVGFLMGAGLLSWVFGYFRFSLAPVFFVMLTFAVLYRSSVRKYRQRLRQQAHREFSVKSIETDYETMDWLNTLLERFWFYLEPSVLQIVTTQLNPLLALSPAPAFIKKLWLDSFTAGTKPPRIDMVKTLSGTADDVVVMDWGVSFTANDLADSNTKQLKNHVNQKVVVKASLFGITIPVTVLDVLFRCLARVRLRMMALFPHIETVNVALLEAPQFDFSARPFGESLFNWEVLAAPGLFPLINEMVKKYVGPLVFSPLSFQLNVQQLMAGNPLNLAIGVLVITVKRAKGLKNYGGIANTVDPYCEFLFTRKVLARTRHIDDTLNPVWNETVNITVNSLSEPLNISIMDYNQRHRDKQIGSVQFDLDVVHDNPKIEEITAPIVRNNKPVGSLTFGLHYMPTLVPQRQADGAMIPPPELNTGIVRIEATGARNLKSPEDKPLLTLVEVLVDSEPLVKSSVVKKNNDPQWGAAEEKIIYNRAKAKVKIIVRDRSNKSDKIYGVVLTRLNDLIDALQVEEPWFQLKNGGEVKLVTNWKPVQLEGASGAGGYAPPIGVVRVNIDRAEDLRNLETIGKVDPYVRLMVNGNQRARTYAFDSTLNPTWNEIHYLTLASANQKLTLEVMDVERLSPDRTLGLFDVKLNDIIKKNELGQYVEHVDTEKREGRLIHKKGPKGSLSYSLLFYPTLPVMTIQEIQDEEESRKAEEKAVQEKLQAAKEKGEDSEEHKEIEKMKELKAEDEELELNKMRLLLDELVEYKSGVFIYEIISVECLKEDVYLQAFFDNHGLHDYVSPKLRKHKNNVGTTGDVIIKELDYSEVNFRVLKKKDNNRAEKCICEATFETLDLLRRAHDAPTTIELAGSGTATVRLQISWVPIIYSSEIPPQDTRENCGVLHIETLRAENVPSGDSNGKSDPYIKLHLNTDKSAFHKTKKVKKTLSPTFNERSAVEVINKYDLQVRVNVFDWDVGPEQDDFLCLGILTLEDVPVDDWIEKEIQLYDEEENEAGKAYFKLSFEPQFLLAVSAEEGDHLENALGHVGSGVHLVGHGAKGVLGHGFGHVGKGVGGVGKGLRKGLHFGRSKD